jgi:hypothetical protein
MQTMFTWLFCMLGTIKKDQNVPDQNLSVPMLRTAKTIKKKGTQTTAMQASNKK